MAKSPDTTRPEGEPMGDTPTRETGMTAGAGADLSGAAPDPKPGDQIANPAEPLAPTKIAERAKPEAFIQPMENFPGYPKRKFHPVHGGIEVKNPHEEAGLLPATDWFDSPELADAARTWTEAHVAGAHNTREKLAVHDDAGQAVVRNSVQADEAVRRGAAEPL